MKQQAFIFLLLISIGLNAQVSLQVEPSSVTAGQSVRLMLTSDSTNQGEPDFSALHTDFNIIGSDNSTNYSIINGQTSSIRQWLLVLMPKRIGTLTIPPLTVGQEHTAATTIDVTQASATDNSSATNDTPQDVMLKAEVNNKTPYINEEMIYTVKLYNSLQLLNPTYQSPVAADALIIPLGQSRSYQANEGGRTYSVEEQHYAIFPQKSGHLTITPPEFNALVYNGSASQVSIKAPKLDVTVKAAPSGQSPWLPAKEVLLRDSWADTKRSLLQGSTLIRKISIEAAGLPAQLLPSLSFDGNGAFSVYAEKPVEKNTLRGNHLLATRTLTLTYLFNKPGKIVIPAITLPWFNTATGKQEVARLPEEAFDIQAANARSTSDNLTIQPAPMVVQSLPTIQTNAAWWWALGFAIAWLLTLMAWLKPWRLFYKKGSAFYLQQLRAACLANDPQCAKQALLQWAGCQWPGQSILHLAMVSQLVTDDALAREINQLAAVLYRSGKHSWQGKALWQSMTLFRPDLAVKTAKNKSFPPINPLS